MYAGFAYGTKVVVNRSPGGEMIPQLSCIGLCAALQKQVAGIGEVIGHQAIR
jgi:hypothetical protein